MASSFTLTIDVENGSGYDISEGMRALDTGPAASKVDRFEPDDIEFVVRKRGAGTFQFAIEAHADRRAWGGLAKTVYDESIVDAEEYEDAFEKALTQIGERYGVSGGVIHGALLNVEPDKSESVGTAFSDVSEAWRWLQEEIGRRPLGLEVEEAWRDEIYKHARWEWDRVVARLVPDVCERIADVMEIPPEVVDDGQGPDEDEDMAPPSSMP